MLPAKLKTASSHAAIDFTDVQRTTGLAQHNGSSLRNTEVVKADVAAFLALLDFSDGSLNVGGLKRGDIKTIRQQTLHQQALVQGWFGHLAGWHGRHRTLNIGIGGEEHAPQGRLSLLDDNVERGELRAQGLCFSFDFGELDLNFPFG